MPQIPSGYIQLPLWVVTAAIAVLLALIGYIWHRMEASVDKCNTSVINVQLEIANDKLAIKDALEKNQFNIGRVNKILEDNESSMKTEIQKGGFLTLKEHTEMCHDVCSNIAKMLNERFSAFEKNLELQLENIKLKLLGESKDVERRAARRGKKRGR